MLVHRLGRPQEALRYLAEANRVDPNCPFVTWQMGVSLVASNADSGLAMRALQKALGERGLAMWAKHPERAWVEGFPEGRSYVRRLAAKQRYTCPILGSDLSVGQLRRECKVSGTFLDRDGSLCEHGVRLTANVRSGALVDRRGVEGMNEPDAAAHRVA